MCFLTDITWAKKSHIAEMSFCEFLRKTAQFGSLEQVFCKTMKMQPVFFCAVVFEMNGLTIAPSSPPEWVFILEVPSRTTFAA